MSIQWYKVCEVIGIFDKYTVYWAFGKDCTGLKVSTILAPLYRGGNWLQVNSFGKLCAGCSQQCCWKVYASALCMWVWFSHEVVSDSCDPMDYSPWGSSVHAISQTRILEWVAIFFSRGSLSPAQRSNLIILHCRWILYVWATREADTLYQEFHNRKSNTEVLRTLVAHCEAFSESCVTSCKPFWPYWWCIDAFLTPRNGAI